MTVLVCALISLVLLFADLVIKGWAEAVNVYQADYFLGFIRWNFEENPGMAFGMLANNRTGMIVITALTVVMIIGLVVLFFTAFKHNKPARVGLAIIEAGAIGNLVDRLILGYVRDMVDVSPIGFGVCNFADFYITGGAVFLIFVIMFIGKDAVLPLKKKWRDAAKAEAEEKERAKAAKKQ
ncbi:MAG: signal peptidase II [Clostridia bacterium]|nr:signal peptidase II [Clostridia bacterium]